MGLVKSVKTVINENLSNRRRLVRLAVYDLKNKNGGTVLGFLWNFLNPAFQILIYWFVFAVGLRQGSDIGGVPYIVWLIAGIVPWFFMSSCMLESDTSILSFSSVLKRMTFPMAVVPVKTVAANFMTHFITVIIAFIIVAASGVNAGNQLWQMLYYMFAAVFFLISYALIGSSVTVIFRDYHNIFSFVIRMIFFISPAMWNPDTSNRSEEPHV